jgi:L-ascorbate metabolism protein UlaG (beta-lactamase superfamily)
MRVIPASEEATSAALAVTLVGGPTAIVEYGGLRLLVDPAFSAPGEYEAAPGRVLTKTEGPAIAAADIGRVDAVLLSHDQHPDNLDPAGRELVAAAALTVSTAVAATRLDGTVVGLDPWQGHELTGAKGPIEVTAVPAVHGPDDAVRDDGTVIGFVLRGEGLPVVYVSGDNASVAAARGIRERIGPIEAAVLFAGAARTALFAGAPLTLTAESAVEVARMLDDAPIVPVHTRGWAHFSEGPEVLAAAFRGAGLADRLHVIAPGDRIAFTAVSADGPPQ